MRSYWIWLLFMVAAWLCAWLSLPVEEALKPWRLVVAALFFMLYFIALLLRNRPVWLTSTLIGASILATVALQLEYTGEHSLYVLLIYSLLAGKAIYRLPLFTQSSWELHYLVIFLLLAGSVTLPFLLCLLFCLRPYMPPVWLYTATLRLIWKRPIYAMMCCSVNIAR